MKTWGVVRACLLALMMTAQADTQACSKSVRWYDDAPFSFLGANGQPTGFDVELVRAVLRQIGCEPRFVSMPWARALAELEAGRLDILTGTFQTAERERFAYFSIPSLQSSNILYVGPGVVARYRMNSLEDMLGTDFRLGIQIGVSYGAQFEALRADPRFRANLVPVTLRRNAWQMIGLGRLHGMISDEASASLELEQLRLEGKIKPSAIVVSTNTARVAFSRHSVAPEFVDSFNKSLAAMLTNGEYQKLRARYLPCPTGTRVLGCK